MILFLGSDDLNTKVIKLYKIEILITQNNNNFNQHFFEIPTSSRVGSYKL